MTSPAVVIEERSDLLQLLDEHFSQPSLASLLGRDPARVRWPLWDDALYGPLADFLSRPGKEFRAGLVRAGWQLGGAKTAPPNELCLLIEILHAGSLIVDDIEDQSPYRRGRPALHCTYGTARALNAGNWLYFWPSVLLTRLGVPADVELELHRRIGRTLLCCHHGQALDLAVNVHGLRQNEVAQVALAVSRLKTGALTELAAEIGAIAAAANAHTRQAIAAFGMQLGVGLQMLDDLGGITSEARCQKGHEDLLSGKPIWPWAWAAERCDARAFDKLLEMSQRVQARDLHPEHLAEALRDLTAEHGKSLIHRPLKSALDTLDAAFPHAPAVIDLRQEIERLEASYG
jgi:geranylgeranyl pyrophosphate synthase